MGEIWVPGSIAEHRPLTRSISGYYLRHDVICLHTMVGSLWGSWDWSNRPGGTYWAFGTSGDGQCIQCHDLQFRSAANLYGNPYVIPIENADHGSGFGPWSGRCGDVPPFTQAQIERLIPLVAWLCRAFNIPPVLIPDTRLGRRGIAYHRQGIDPWRVSDGVLWSKSAGKCCPDDPRIWQIVNIIIPGVVALLGGGVVPAPIPKEWDEMATKEEIRAEVQDVVRLEILRFAQKLMANRDNVAYNPADDAWLAEAVSLPQALEAVDGRLLRTVQAIMGRSNTFLNPAEQPWLEESARLNDLDAKLDAILAKLPGAE